MLCKFVACSTLAALVFAASPSQAMSVVTAPANSSGASRFADPNAKPQRPPFTGSLQTFATQRSGSFGFGGSVIAGTRTPGFGAPVYSRSEPPFPEPGFSNTSPFGSGSIFADPAYGPGGAVSPMPGNAIRQ
jgi:hypothetical protein